MNSKYSTDYLIPNYGRLPMAPVRGQGSYLWDDNGKRYLDFAAGVAVCTLGHCHPVMVNAIREQSEILIHCSNWFQIPNQAALAEFLSNEVVCEPGKVFFCNSGAEANEALVKLARRYGNESPAADGSPRYEVLTCSRSFHGRTLATIAATEQEKVRLGFAPYMPGFRYVPFNDPDSLRNEIRPETVALLIEPVQGEGGINPASAEFLNASADICREHDLLLMFDEIQCGLGRVGNPCGWKATGAADSVKPDAISWAKGMAGGFPIGAIWASNRAVGRGHESSEATVSNLLRPGTHGSTFGGSPLASAVALAVQQEVAKQGLAAKAAEFGDYILNEVSGWKDARIVQTKGMGLMLGFKLEGDAPEGTTLSGQAQIQLLEAGLLTVPAGPDVVRWVPPLTVSREEIDEGLTIMRKTLRKD